MKLLFFGEKKTNFSFFFCVFEIFIKMFSSSFSNFSYVSYLMNDDREKRRRKDCCQKRRLNFSIDMPPPSLLFFVFWSLLWECDDLSFFSAPHSAFRPFFYFYIPLHGHRNEPASSIHRLYIHIHHM